MTLGGVISVKSINIFKEILHPFILLEEKNEIYICWIIVHFCRRTSGSTCHGICRCDNSWNWADRPGPSDSFDTHCLRIAHPTQKEHHLATIHGWRALKCGFAKLDQKLTNICSFKTNNRLHWNIFVSTDNCEKEHAPEEVSDCDGTFTFTLLWWMMASQESGSWGQGGLSQIESFFFCARKIKSSRWKMPGSKLFKFRCISLFDKGIPWRCNHLHLSSV